MRSKYVVVVEIHRSGDVAEIHVEKKTVTSLLCYWNKNIKTYLQYNIPKPHWLAIQEKTVGKDPSQ